jgi:ribosome-binding factor A
MVNPRAKARIEARIHERAAHCIEFEINDPRATFLTITRVELSDDLSHGKIFYSVLGTAADRSKAEHMLASAAGFIQRQVSRVLEMRRMPRLVWIYDESIAEAARMQGVIEQALERDKLIAQTGKAPEPDDPDWQREYEEFAGDDKPAPKPPPSED